MEAIFKPIMSLKQTLVDKLQGLIHTTGKPVVSNYKSDTSGSCNSWTHGSVVTINVIRADGSLVECRAVVEAAAPQNIGGARRVLCDPESHGTNHQKNIAKIEPSHWLHVKQKEWYRAENMRGFQNSRSVIEQNV